LRKERTIFDGIYNGLETDILKKKNELLTLIEKKDEIQQKRSEKEKLFEHMQKQSAKENDFFEQHYASIIENIDQDDPKSMIDKPSVMIDAEAIQAESMILESPSKIKRKAKLMESAKKGNSLMRSPTKLDTSKKTINSDFNDRYDMLSEMNELFNKLHL